ncbi:hypothetical protein GDO81_011104 [Engystomops pustulosus]|uniref:Retroelement silencing factor 1 n=1 Tax=Engystomops pustulosus TaxID=76066 RepID=A0AAV7C698_ENGPU|nr:hypothetical protein GDO81_011104 [Engystomops pustulosus]
MVQQQGQPVTMVQQQGQPVQCYGANGSLSIQQSQKNTPNSGYSHKRAYEQKTNNYPAKRQTYQQIQNPKQNPLNVMQNGNAGLYVASFKVVNDKNVPVSTSSYQNGQNIPSRMISSYQPMPHTNALQTQIDAQILQRQVLPTGFANNSSLGQMQTLYSQANPNATNINNAPTNQMLSNPSQKLVPQNVQQPVPSYTMPQEQHTTVAPPPAYSANVQPEQQRPNGREILRMLQVYRNVKQQYLQLNRENNLLRQKMLSSSQDNSGSCALKPPLISTLPNCAFPTNETMGGQDPSQNLTMQNQAPSNLTNGVTLYDNSLNVDVRNMAQPGNSFSTQAYPTNNGDAPNQRSYNNFDCGQMSLEGSANSAGQAIGSESLQDMDPHKTSMASLQGNNQHSYISQDGSSVQNLAQRTTAHTENYNPDQTTISSHFYLSKLLTSSSREAIKATLSLWKTAPQGSAQNKSVYPEPKAKLDTVANGLDIQILDGMTSSSKNDPPPVSLTQKLEHSGLNVAIVSPLVKMKEMANERNQQPKAVPQGEDLANSGVGDLKENERLSELLKAIKSVNTASVAASTNKLPEVQYASNTASSLSSNIDQNSTEEVDENLQISGICTLVEGNSFYDSSIAMMFEGSLEAQTCTQLATDPKIESPRQCSQEEAFKNEVSQARVVSPTEKMVTVKSPPQGEIMACDNMKSDEHESSGYCLELQSEENLSSSEAFGSESNTVSDQLSELLTEFPFGIKNYMSENKVERSRVSLGKLEDKSETLNTLGSLSCDGGSNELIKDIKKECDMDISIEEMKSLKTEVIDQSLSKVSTPEVFTEEMTSDQIEEDGFEICESPDDSIQITLLTQDEIPKLFPEESDESNEQGEASSVESLTKESDEPVEDVPESSTKEGSDDEMASVSDKQLFCCLFSWLTHTNGNAPKCNCKLTELIKPEDLKNFSQLSSVVKTEPSPEDHDPPADSLESSSPVPCKTELEVESNEIHAAAIKPPKLEKEIEDKSGLSVTGCSQQEEIQAKLDLSEKNLESPQKDLTMNERIVQSKNHLEDPISKNSAHSFGYTSKVDGTRKSEKLIVKTDFLKNKHLLKMKKKYKELKNSRVDESVAKNSQNKKTTEVGESANIQNVQRIFEGKAYNEPYKLPTTTAQQSDSVNKLKSYSGSEKSHSRSQAPPGRKRKERVKTRESHFEKVKKVPTVQEYLERKRELCNKRSGQKYDQRDGQAEVRHGVLENPSIDISLGGLLAKHLTTSNPGKIHFKPKNIQSEAIHHDQRGQSRSSGTIEPYLKKHRGSSGSHGKRSLVNQNLDQNVPSSKGKIYLSPCDGSRRASCDGISLTKLQIIRSPEKLGYFDRRKSVDSSVSSKTSMSETNNKDSPKMLQFKLCPEFVSRSPTTQEKKETKTAKEKSVVEGIKSKKEAWCSGGPVKKTRMDGSLDDHGRHSPSQLTSSFMATPKNSSRPVQDSQTTFNAFKQKYHEQRSKSLDGSL